MSEGRSGSSRLGLLAWRNDGIHGPGHKSEGEDGHEKERNNGIAELQARA